MLTNYDYIVQLKPEGLADFIKCPYENAENLDELLSHCIFEDEGWPRKRDCRKCKLRFLLSDI